MAKSLEAMVTGKPDPGPETAKTYVTNAAYWVEQIDQALKREDAFRKAATKAVQIYECDREDSEGDHYNILFSNTETMAPALYNSTPVPVVKRRFDDPDPLGEQAAKAGQRVLKYLSDDGMSEDSTFDELLMSAVLEALVPGRGVTRFEYDAVMAKKAKVAAKNDDPMAQQDATDYDTVESETVCGQEVPWDRFLHGYGKRWKDVPWVAFFEPMTREELVENFGAEIGNKVPVTSPKSDSSGSDSPAVVADPHGLETIKLADVYQIWDKASKTVVFISPAYKDQVLKSTPDPLGLTGFFPCPKPLMFRSLISSIVPSPLYLTYQDQAKELNRVTQRINKIINAMKVRGIYDTTVQGLDKVMQAGDNELIPAENVAAMMNNGTLEKAIWLFPIQELVAVLQQLYVQRQQVKQVIYEITGIADIMRGSTQASETLGAQELKNQWGTLRLKRAQKQVARYARDCFRIMEEIAFSKFQPQTLQKMTGLPYPMQAEKAQAQMIAQQLAQQQAAQAAQMPPQPPQPGQPPGPPPGPQIPPPLQAILNAPTWEQIQGLLQDDVSRSFRIDIETNSTIDAEATQDKQDIGELLTALSQFLSGVAPLVESGAMPFDVVKSIMLVIVRRFRFGTEIEDQLSKMTPPQPKPDPAMIKAQMDAQASQQQMAQTRDQHQMDMQMKHLDLRGKQAETQMNLQTKQQEHTMKLQELSRKNHAAVLQHDLKIKQTQAQVIAAEAQAQAAVKAAQVKPQPASGAKK